MRIYGDVESGNCYKVKLAADLLGLAYAWVEIDITRGESRTPAFLAMNPNGKIPLLEAGPGRYLPESNAILYYLAEGTRLLPAERWLRAQVLQWMFFEQYSHEPYVAVARFYIKYLGQADEKRELIAEKQLRGYKALEVMEGHLKDRRYFVGDALSIADIALYAYTHVAHEGGFELAPYPAVRAWLARVAAEPGYTPMYA